LSSLPDYLRDPAVGRDTFYKHLKTFLFCLLYNIGTLCGKLCKNG